MTGSSGSGKSSVFSDILVEALRRDLNGGKGVPGEHDRIDGTDVAAINDGYVSVTPIQLDMTHHPSFAKLTSLLSNS